MQLPENMQVVVSAADLGIGAFLKTLRMSIVLKHSKAEVCQGLGAGLQCGLGLRASGLVKGC